MKTMLKCLFFTMSVIFAAEQFNAKQQNAIEKIVKKYIAAHPDIVLEALQKAQEQLSVQKQIKAEKYIKDHQQELMALALPYTIDVKTDAKDGLKDGSRDAKVFLLEFMDYRCGYCRSVYQDILSLKDFEVSTRVSFIQMPILGGTSVQAAAIALSAPADKFAAVNHELFTEESEMDEAYFQNLLTKYEINITNKDAILEKLTASQELASKLEIQGAPAIVITNGKDVKIFYGRVELSILKEQIKAMK